MAKMHESPLNLGHKNSDDSFHYMHISISEILPNGVVLLHLDINACTQKILFAIVHSYNNKSLKIDCFCCS